MESPRRGNPFETYDLDPREGPEGVTARLRELIEDAPSELAKAEIRAAWEELTLHPRRRLRAALLAHPESRKPKGLPPIADPRPAPPPALTLATLLPRPSVAAPLKAGSVSTDLPRVSILSLQDDPHLRSPAS